MTLKWILPKIQASSLLLTPHGRQWFPKLFCGTWNGVERCQRSTSRQSFFFDVVILDSHCQPIIFRQNQVCLEGRHCIEMENGFWPSSSLVALTLHSKSMVKTSLCSVKYGELRTESVPHPCFHSFVFPGEIFLLQRPTTAENEINLTPGIQ